MKRDNPGICFYDRHHNHKPSSKSKKKYDAPQTQHTLSEEELWNDDLRQMYRSDEMSKHADVMTQITYSFKKLDIKDSRKKVEKSIKNRRIVEKMPSFTNVQNRSLSREKSVHERQDVIK